MTTPDKWAVLVAENAQGNPLLPGLNKTTLDQPSEEAAQKVYADHVHSAETTARWVFVKLRKNDEIIDEWPDAETDDDGDDHGDD